MKAVIYNKYGSPEVLHIVDVAAPKSKTNQVLVKVEASSVTVADMRLRKASPFLIRLLYGLFAPKKTKILGFEVSGKVVACGSEVHDFNIDDRIFAYCTSIFGGYGEYIALDAAGPIAIMPESLDYAEAAVIPVAGVTVLWFLKKTKIQKGERVLVHGASGSVGSYAVQIAKFFRANVTAVCSANKAAFVKELGADEVIDYRGKAPKEYGQPYDVVMNNVPQFRKSKFKKVLKPDSRYVSVWEQIKASKADMKDLTHLFEIGAYKPIVNRVFPVSEIQDAHTYAESKKKKGNVAIRMVW